MPRRRAVLGLTAALLAAGCLTTLAPQSMDSRLDLARDAASRWSPNATLAGVLGTEGSLTPEAPSGQEDAVPTAPTEGISVDGEIGDGEALVWFFAFVAPEKDETLAVASGPAVGGMRSGQYEGYDLEPVGEWSVDSTDAAEAAARNSSFAEAADEPGARIYYELHQPPNGSASWRVYASPAGELGWTAVVDASTGEAEVHEGTPTWGWQDPRDSPPHDPGPGAEADP